MTEFKLQELGENIEEAEVIRLLVSEGDEIEADQNVLEVESEKAATPLPCPFAGKVSEIHVKEGETIQVGQTLLTIEEAEEAEESPSEEKPPEEGDEKPTKKKTKEVSSESREKDKTPEGEEETKEPTPKEKKPQPKAKAKETDAEGPENGKKEPPVPAGPATRRMAREMDVKLDEIEGTGSDGRITREDVRRAAKQEGGEREVKEPALPDFKQWGSVRREPLNQLAKTAAKRLSMAWRLIPHVTQNDLVDVTELEKRRREFNQKEDSPKITMTTLIAKAAVVTLEEFPKFNSSFDSANGELIVKEYYHLGFAVDTEQGLLVPILRDADQKDISTLAGELEEIAEKARNQKLGKEDMEGGTFTITNVGSIAGTTFTPIINYPEVAILGVGQAQGENENRLRLPLSLSYDHRVINGADGARFMKRISNLLEDSFQFLAEI